MKQKKQQVDSRTMAFMLVRFVFGMVINITAYLLLIMFAIQLCTTSYDYAYQIFGNVAVSSGTGTDVTLSIESGDSSMAVSEKLWNNRVIKNQYMFYIRTKLSTGERKPILPGEYTFNTSMTYEDIIDMITDPEYQAKKDEEKK